MDVVVFFPISGATILAILCLVVFMFDAITNGLSGETMEVFANEYTIYFFLAFLFASIAIALLVYSKSRQKRKKTFQVRFRYFSGGICLFFFLCTAYIWTISAIWNLLEFLGMGLFVFIMGFPIAAIIYLLIGAGVLVPFGICFYCFFITDNEKITRTASPIACIISSAIYCYVMYVFDFFSYLATSCSSIFN